MNSLDPVWETIKRQFEAARSESAQTARSELIKELNHLVRRLRQYQSQGEWGSAILDGASQFARQTALFSYHDGVLDLLDQRNLNLAENLSFPVVEAAAFKGVIESNDAVVALRTASEVGGLLGSSNDQERAYIVPIMNGPRVVAFLFAVQEEQLDLSALDLIAGLASTVLERRSNASLHAQIAIQPTTAKIPTASNSRSLPSWADLGRDQHVLHVRAQRFARVKVAEMQLSRPDACRAGRQQSNLYVFLRAEIEKARDTYRKQFMTIPSMVDYLHLELVGTAAAGDEQRLGADYPGQLV